jgi:uncharacterized membrane protein
VTHLRQIMLEELERRNYAPGTISCYIRAVEHFARHFHRPPDQLGPEHIREYQSAMFRKWKLAPNTVAQRLAETAFSDPSCASKLPSQKLRYQAVIWGPDLRSVKRLPLLGTDAVSVALWMNDKGQAVGASGACSNTQPPPIAYGWHAILWEADGTPVDLGNLGSTAGNVGLSINNRGEVVGASQLRDDSTPFNGTVGFFWTRQHGMKNLGTLPGDVASGAVAINDAGEIVGISIDPAGNLRDRLLAQRQTRRSQYPGGSRIQSVSFVGFGYQQSRGDHRVGCGYLNGRNPHLSCRTKPDAQRNYTGSAVRFPGDRPSRTPRRSSTKAGERLPGAPALKVCSKDLKF